MAKIKPIRITATVFKVATMIDGGYRVTLDAIPPTELSEIMRIIESKKPGFCLEIVALPVEPEAYKDKDVGSQAFDTAFPDFPEMP